MKHPKHWYIVKKLARKLGFELFPQDASKFFQSSFRGDRSPILSFCITHKNRFDHLKKTLPKNLEDNRLQSDQVEFVIADFHETDEVAVWVANNLMKDIESGFLKYFHSSMSKWSSPLAKNTAHWLGQGEILTNLDCDNYTGAQGGQFVIDQFRNSEHELMLWQYSRVRRDGSYGRISLTKWMMEKMGGYDEELIEMGFQDNDLMNRAIALGVKRIEVNDREYNRAIKHEKYTPADISFHELHQRNAMLSKSNVASGKLFANEGIYGIRQNIKKMSASGTLDSWIPEEG